MLKKASIALHLYRGLLRCALLLYHGVMLFLKIFPKREPTAEKKISVMATGTFYSDHWLVTHLRPMANAGNCQHLTMVAATQVPQMNKVSAAYAPQWLQKIAGQVGARLFYFSWLAIKQRPDVLVGFHLLLNGLFVALLARLIGAKSVYICGGGPREVAGGGFSTENRIFRRIGYADDFIESLLLKAVNEMDLVISMGTTAVKYFQEKGVNTKFQIVPGGFDNTLFKPACQQDKIFDLILIGRLSQVKRVDRFLYALKQAKQIRPDLTAVIVGDGPDKEKLQKLALALGIGNDVYFAGWQTNVHYWLRLSKSFVLSSDSEGLSQALIQAMMSGLPAITSDVGDLSDLLKNKQNGYLISSLTPENFAQAFIQLAENNEEYTDFSRRAYESTMKYSVAEVEKEWEQILSDICVSTQIGKTTYD